MAESESVASAEQRAGQDVWNLPNALTLSRLVMAFVVCELIALGWYWPALGIFALAALTDAFDGMIARALHQTSALGRQLDPLVDKIMVIVVLVHLLPAYRTPSFPWIVTVIVAREVSVQALRSLVEGKGLAFGARSLGKLKTVFQCFAVAAVIVVLAEPGAQFMKPVSEGLLWTTAVLTVWSGWAYLKPALSALNSGASA
jgi:CDP-diacylglycerol--glycerol-3-phosphate 3-phosphatidyltransferase